MKRVLLARRGVDDLLVAIRVAEIDQGFNLDQRVIPPVVHAESDQIDLGARHNALGYPGVLFIEVVCKRRAVIYWDFSN